MSQSHSGNEVANDLYPRFEQACLDLGIAEPETIFATIEAQYSTGRVYHTFNHLHYMFKVSDTVLSAYPLNSESILAIFLHDAIYNPGSDANEADSAAYARQLFHELPESILDRICTYIMATEQHESDNPEAQVIIDLDLASLGSKPELFESNSHRLMAEFSHLAEEDFLHGQAAYLQRFLHRTRIYYTPEMRNACETQARKNLESFISTHLRPS